MQRQTKKQAGIVSVLHRQGHTRKANRLAQVLVEPKLKINRTASTKSVGHRQGVSYIDKESASTRSGQWCHGVTSCIINYVRVALLFTRPKKVTLHLRVSNHGAAPPDEMGNHVCC